MNAPAEPGATTVPHRAGSLTILQGAALYIGAVLGTGVIALPALAAEVAGPASLLAGAGLGKLGGRHAAPIAARGPRRAGGDERPANHDPRTAGSRETGRDDSPPPAPISCRCRARRAAPSPLRRALRAPSRCRPS